MFRTRELAEEAAQETFLAVYRSLWSFAGRSTFAVWLFGVTYRTCLRLLRKECRRRDMEVGLESEAMALFPDQHGRPPDAALLGARLDREVAGLPPRMRMALLLHYKEELSLAEVAQTLDCPVGTVKTLLFRGRRAIRLALEGEAAHGL
jgi:RNA polymerase sigma-70 factor (ECF subfamily)